MLGGPSKTSFWCLVPEVYSLREGGRGGREGRREERGGEVRRGKKKEGRGGGWQVDLPSALGHPSFFDIWSDSRDCGEALLPKGRLSQQAALFV